MRPSLRHLLSRLVSGLVGGVLALGLLACSASEEPEPARLEPPESPGLAESKLTCDAGDRAFVRRAIFDLWGRRPRSIREVDLLAATVAERGRADVTQAMMRSVEYLDRYENVLRDFLFINRAGSRANEDCFGPRLDPEPTAALAEFLRDNPPGSGFDRPWNMSDLLRSGLVLDDLTPVIRAHLFTQAASEVIDADDMNDEFAWRQVYADLFERRLLNRRTDCLKCHNSEYSVTGDVDPALDRTWEVPGHYEKAIYGASQGRAGSDLAVFFRIRTVVALKLIPEGPEFWVYDSGVSPWNLTAGCGQFIPPANLEPDDLGGSGYLVREYGPTASIWDLETLLKESFDALRGRTPAVGDDASVSGPEALAWLMAMAISEHLWQEVMGAPLTVPHGFPRNRYQRDVLWSLATAFVRNGYSVRAVLETILLHPYYNQGGPALCPDQTPYHLAPLFDPWVIDETVEERRNNSSGDLVVRAPARTLLNAAAEALDWTPAPGFWSDDEAEGVQLDPQAAFQRDIGAFIRDGETGFRGSNFQESLAWEDAIGSCEDPAGDGPDWVDALAEAASGQTWEAAIVALKDRLITEPTIGADEGPLIEALIGHALTDTVGADATVGLRRMCAVLLASPQFQLEGASPRALPDSPPSPLVVPGSDTGALCDELRGLWDEARCQDGRLVFE